jgi:sarcosine oxidase subunit beta
VSTSGGAIAAPIVVNAAGPAAARVGRFAGVALPVYPRRRHIFYTEPFPEIRGPVPITTDTASGFYFRKEMEQLLLSPGDVTDIGDDTAAPVDWAMMEEAVTKAVHRVPAIERARIAGGWAGLRPLTPDDHAILGWAPGVEGFFLAVGWGGHGFQHSPATGRVVAEWIAAGRPPMDLSLFDPARFHGRTPPLPGEGGTAGADAE